MKSRSILIKIFLIIILFSTNMFLASAEEKNSGVCEYSDEYIEWLNMTEEERSKIKMPNVCKIDSEENLISNITSYSLKKSTTIPSKYDSRNITLSNGTNASYISSVKNQASTGSCWAFSTNSVVESYMIKFFDMKTIDLSERHMEYTLANNSYTDNNTYEIIFNRELDIGGTYFLSAAYLMDNLGTVDESSVPFVDSGSPTSYSEINNDKVKQNVDVNSISMIYNESDDNDKYSCDNIKTNIKEAIMKTGSVGAYVYYSGNYINSNTAAYYYKGSNSTNHAISIVGWDDDYSASNFKSTRMPSSNGAWIVKNSWGTSSASMDNGYFYVSYEDTQICEMAMVINDVDNEPTDNLYQNEKQGYNAASLYTYSANIYNRNLTDDMEILKEVTVAATGGANVDIYLIDNVNSISDVSKSNGVKLGTVSVSYSGYETLKLDEPITLTGEKFAILAYYYNSSETYLMGISLSDSDDASAYTTVPATNEVSYASKTGKSWIDTSKQSTRFVPVIKAGTNYINYKMDITNNTSKKINSTDGGNINFLVNSTNILDGEELKIEIYNSKGLDVTDLFNINNNQSLIFNNNSLSINVNILNNLAIDEDEYTIKFVYKEIEEESTFTIYEKKSLSITSKTLSKDKFYDIDTNDTINYSILFTNVSNNSEYTVSIESLTDNISYDISGTKSNVIDGVATISLNINSASASDYRVTITLNEDEDITITDTFKVHQYHEISNLSFDKSDINLQVGDKYNLYDILSNNGEDELDFKFTLNDSSISINNGVVTSLKRGKSIIQVTPKFQTPTLETTATITINSYLSNIELNSDINNSDIYETVGGTLKFNVLTTDVNNLTVKIYDEDNHYLYNNLIGENVNVNITSLSSNNYLIEITLNEKVTADKYILEVEGTYVDDNVISNDIVYETFDVLDEIKITKISISNIDEYMKIGESIEINTSVEPSNATNSKITYNTSNVLVAGFEDNILTAYSKGTVTITATAPSGVTDSKKITIIDPEAVVGDISYIPNSNIYSNTILYDKIGGIVEIPYKENDVVANTKILNSSNEEVNFVVQKDTVNNKYLINILNNSIADTYTFKLQLYYIDDEGNVDIESLTKKFTINQLIETTSINFSSSNYETDINNGTFNINPIINNNDSIPTYNELTWSSSDEKIAKYENNVIKLLSTGTVAIIVKSVNNISCSFVLSIIDSKNPTVKTVNIFENSSYINSNNYITNVQPNTTKTSFINNLNLSNVNYTINVSGTYVGTGTTLTVTQNNEKIIYTIIIFGDINGDGKIKSADYMMIKNHIMGTDVMSSGSIKILSADVYSDGRIRSSDYMMIKNYIMGTDNISQKRVIGGN